MTAPDTPLPLVDALGLTLDPQAPDVVALVGGGGKTSALTRLGNEIAAGGLRAILTCTTHLSYEQVNAAPALVMATGPQLPLDAIARALDLHRQVLVIGPPGGLRRQGLTPEQVDALASHAPALDVAAIVVEADGSRQLPVKAPAAHEPVLPSRTTLLAPVIGIEAVGRPPAQGLAHRPDLLAACLQLDPAAPSRLTPALAATLLLHPQGGAKGLPPAARLVPIVNKVERADQLAAARLIAARCVAAGRRCVIAALGSALDAPVRERWAPWAVIILAAGAGSRLGVPKPLAPVDGEAMVRRAVRTALAGGAPRVLLVTGAHAGDVAAALADLIAAEPARLTLVHNPDWANGQASSMQVGLAALDAACAAAVFMPVDQPYLPATLLARLAQAWRKGAQLAAPTVDGRLRGAPALFDRTTWPALNLVRGDVGGRSVLAANADRVYGIATDATDLYDVDTPQDLLALRGR